MADDQEREDGHLPTCVVTIGQSFSDPAWDVNCATHGRLATQIGRIEAAEVMQAHYGRVEHG